jgi:virulence factor Mce-like protein
MARTERRHRAYRRLQGLAFLVVVVVLLGLTVVIYTKKLPWQSTDEVTLHATRIGNQLIIPADVKYEGVLVGRVSSVHSDGENATLNLQLSKTLINSIPGNVQARILPKTLFGEKYVDLVLPRDDSMSGISPATRSLQAGDVIEEDRSEVAVELQQVFTKLVPVLRAANPAALSVALSNTAMALQGRGDRLGHSFELINSYFRKLNQDLPNIQHDISGLADLASNYADAAPDLLAILKHFSVTAKTFTVKADPYAQFLAGTTGFADTAADFFKKNGKGLKDLAKYSEGPLGVLSDYSIVLECLPNGLSIFERDRLSHAFKGGELHIHLIPVNSRGKYTEKDHPSIKEFTRAVLPANCYGLPYGNHALHPENSKYPFAPGGNYSMGGYAGSSAATPDATRSSLYSTSGVGSAAEQAQIRMLVSEVTGQQPASDGLTDLLLGPLLRGMVVVQR